MAICHIDDRALDYIICGAGSALVLPHCNFSWPQALIDQLSLSFRVIVVSPRGFQRSTRIARPPYDPAWIIDDVEAVLDHLDINRYSLFGYSMTGVMAPWIATRSNRVDAVISGGYPIVGDCSTLASKVVGDLENARADTDVWTKTLEFFDPDAAIAFYRAIGQMRPNELIDAIHCPLYCFWGAEDEVMGPAQSTAQRHWFAGRGVPYRIYPGYDHGGLLAAIDRTAGEAARWLLRALATTS